MGSNRKQAVKIANTGSGVGKRIALAVGACLLAGLAVVGGIAYKQMNRLGGKGGAQAFIQSIRNPREQFPMDKSRVNILLLGKDYDHDARGIQFTGGEGNGKGSRTDSIVVASLDLDKQKVSLLSIPRDTRVVGPDGKVGKINAIYRNHGREALMKIVADLLGVAPDHYIAVKPDSVKEIVNALGGVEVEPIDFMKYHDQQARLTIDLPAGRQIINGEQAVGFARFREADIYERNPDGSPVYTGQKDSQGNPIFVRRRHVEHSKEEGDPRRIARQQQLIRAMTKKATSFSNLFQIDTLVDVSLKQLDTDLDRNHIFAIAALFRTVNPDSIQSGALQGHGEKRGGTFLFMPDRAKTQAAVDWLLKGDESAANRLTIVQVQNATAIVGAARRVADLLKEQGFDVQRATNSAPRPAPGANEATPAPNEATRIVYSKASYAARAQHIAELIGGGKLEKQVTPDKTGADGYEHEFADVTVILGRDLASRYAPQTARR